MQNSEAELAGHWDFGRRTRGLERKPTEANLTSTARTRSNGSLSLADDMIQGRVPARSQRRFLVLPFPSCVPWSYTLLPEPLVIIPASEIWDEHNI